MMNIKTNNSQTVQASSFRFDDTVFSTIPTVEYSPQFGHSYGSNMQPIHEVMVDGSYALKNAMQWVSNYGPTLQMISYVDVLALKELSKSFQEIQQHVDMTNPLVLKAFESFLLVAKLHSETKVNG